MKLSHSRMPFVRVYFRETQELVFDAHDKAFAFYGGVCRRGIYDNMKTAVEAILVGKARKYNQRFCADVFAPSGRPGGLLAGIGVGEGPGREPGRQPARPVLPPQAAGGQPARAQRMARGSMHRLRQADPASRVQGPDDLGCVPGRTGKPDGLARTVRRLCREGRACHHHLSDHGRS